MTTTHTNTTEDVTAARDDVVRRLEALARMVQASTAGTVEAYDDAYSIVVKAARTIRTVVES